MRILREDAETKVEELPISFITDTISKGWEEVGYLKDACAAIKSEYQNTEKVEQLMQDLMDAYLVFIGQLEAHLHQEDYIEAPVLDEPEDKPAEEPKVDVKEVEEPLPAAAVDIAPVEEINPDTEVDADASEVIADEGNFDDFKVDDTKLQAAKEPIAPTDDFDFFVDFDEPDMSAPRLTDDELYGHEDSEYEQNKLRSML
jgi:hypothetical protein